MNDLLLPGRVTDQMLSVPTYHVWHTYYILRLVSEWLVAGKMIVTIETATN